MLNSGWTQWEKTAVTFLVLCFNEWICLMQTDYWGKAKIQEWIWGWVLKMVKPLLNFLLAFLLKDMKQFAEQNWKIQLSIQNFHSFWFVILLLLSILQVSSHWLGAFIVRVQEHTGPSGILFWCTVAVLCFIIAMSKLQTKKLTFKKSHHGVR